MGRSRRQRRSSGLRLWVVALVLALLAAACGGGGGGDGGNETASPGGGVEGVQEEGGDTEQPRPGGRAVVGLEAEVDGFDPTKNRFPVAGLTYGFAVYDPLAAYDQDGVAQPYLAESITPNADYTVWTIKARPNVKFHDGTPFNAASIKRNLDAHKKSALTGSALAPLESVTVVDDLTVTAQMKQPWVPFPTYLTGAIGFQLAPTMLDNPEGSRRPIGTGPFVFQEWVPGQRFRATKNPNYWRQGLPYLDEVELRPIVEFESRTNSLVSGDIHITHTTDTQTIVDLRENDDIEMVELDEGATEENFILLNTATPPFNNINARRALALATDRQRVIDTVYNGILKDATGPFSGQEEYGGGEVSTYPDYDPDAARQAVEAYRAETGQPLRFTVGTTNLAKNLQIVQLLQDMWREVGIQADITQVEQSQYILNALRGEFQAYGWRQYGEPDPDQDYIWWSKSTTAPPGQLSLNFSRSTSDEVQRLLEEGRTNPDREARAKAYQGIAEEYGRLLPFIYTSKTLWAIPHRQELHIQKDFTLPSGEPAGDPVAGTIRSTNLWIEQ